MTTANKKLKVQKSSVAVASKVAAKDAQAAATAGEQPVDGAVANAEVRSPCLPDRVKDVLGPVVEVNITGARARLPKMVSATADGTVFWIANAKNPDAPPTLLIGLAALERVIQQAVEPMPSRTMGEILDSLPFSDVEVRAERMEALPGGGLPSILLPD